MPESTPARRATLRVATFNLAASYPTPVGLPQALAAPSAALQRAVAILQQVRPDVVLLNEFDHDGVDASALTAFQGMLSTPASAGQLPLDYPYHMLVPSNTGRLSPVDLDGDGVCRLPGDGLGFGSFPGQYAMVVLSRYPLLTAQQRSFRRLRWAQMPGALLPHDPLSGAPFYSPAALDVLPLSSKNHLDLPVQVPTSRGPLTLHLLCSHPTPPVFDGPERRNRCRNHDEIRLWTDYLEQAGWLVDDAGQSGGLAADARFVLLGDLNADADAGDGDRRAIRHLLQHPRVHAGVARGAQRPRSRGALVACRHPRATHLRGLRLDYVLPDAGWRVVNSGVFWPAAGEPGRAWIAGARGRERADWCSDHRLVWVDLLL